LRNDSLAKFYTAVVVEYFAKTIDSSESINALVSKYEKSKTPIIFPNRLFAMPRGSILARYIDNPDKPDVRIFYPFFSHMSMPVKAGEQVFVQDNGVIGYWFTRKVSDSVAEDPNYTHNDRSNYSSTFIKNELSTGTVNPVAKLFPDDGFAGISYGEVVGLAETTQSEFVGEAVPRYSTVSSDFSLQGSNNSLIVLGSSATLGQSSTTSGLIDIVVGRGQSSSTAPQASYLNARRYLETDKTAQQNLNEGSLDLINDLSRIHVSMNMNPDASFDSSFGEDTGSGPSVVIKTNKVRVFAREDIKISVGNDENSAGIIIKSTGDIVIIPSPTGLVKIGGDDADKAILCQEAITTEGFVVAPSIISTAGGLIGAPDRPRTGVFASKILVK